MRIALYERSHFPDLVRFLRANWAQEHVLYSRELFEWQYRIASGSHSFVAVDDGGIAGFLGNIPGEYLVDGALRSGAGLTMWCVAPKYRDTGLGILLLREAEQVHSVTLTLGANPYVVPIYRRMKYSVLPRLHRYVLPLEAGGYARLLDSNPGREELSAWAAAVHSDIAGAPVPESCGAAVLAETFRRNVAPAFRFTLKRGEAFWQWRYFDSPGFFYHAVGDPHFGAAILRIEQTLSPTEGAAQRVLVLRILELLPPDIACWDGGDLDLCAPLIRGVLRWARELGCGAADFQISNTRLAGALARRNFCEQLPEGTAATSMAQLFQPLRHDTPPINFLWKVGSEDGNPLSIPSDDTYFVKSDCDMDRPNIITQPC